MSGKCANGEGSIYRSKNGFAAYAWITTPEGDKRKYVYGKTREETHEKWIKLHSEAGMGPVQTRHRTVQAFLAYWLEPIVKPDLAPLSYVSYEGSVRLYINPHLGGKRLDKLTGRDVPSGPGRPHSTPRRHSTAAVPWPAVVQPPEMLCAPRSPTP
ncbi:hypothetical protein S1361_19540 [Streptomyces cyanogenus]|uniref:Integrase SAM-like N-terminal domain-containing protein n=1 Tax=Streptomyces cyanogenus TaxID=80860 RepID=A0ABX7TS30_STRCY|nr:N-terminal phage integrase SAM-like domain-containing protein [Streptomyces cyanogenus]QTD99542.1 hypothetical protein S1361_19540 [Streptomyces cyanogenus]